MKVSKNILGAAVSSIAMGMCVSASADSFTDALTSGKTSADVRLRYESVAQDNAADDATALTIRTRLGYTTGSFEGLSATVEFEDSRIVASVDEYTVEPTGFNPGEYSVIADPEVTELDQGFLQYKAGMFTAKLGRQVMTFDNHRFLGHVGWRQDRQTFDGLALNIKPSDELSISYNYIGERKRIFAEVTDVKSNDHLVNASYKTPVGTLTGYGYFLELDNDTDNALDTIGVRFSGRTDAGSTKIIYTGEYATQSSESGGADYDASYLDLEVGAVFGGVKVLGGYEVLGSDEGLYGFSTPLATLHKFNGWADIFLGTPDAGLQDLSLTVSGKVLGGGWKVALHDFSTDESGANDDLGSEIDASFGRGFGKIYNAGIKLASYNSGDVGVDTDKIWLWVGAKF
ncbi:MAG: hypothetical protein ACI9Y1_000891 [Lentisphaeria bacterium]|jgi:hypothetical protein